MQIASDDLHMVEFKEICCLTTSKVAVRAVGKHRFFYSSLVKLQGLINDGRLLSLLKMTAIFTES